ncbi:MAG: hypothetical protein H3C54_08910, partial [Taibaiella sp.]|nr:hypothetical protein [Taibaiella sp.]
MKQRYTILLTAFLLLVSQLSYAQKFRWLTGGGSTEIMNNGVYKGEWVTHMCTDDNGNVYTLALVGDYNIKADTFSLNQSFNATNGESWNTLFMSHDCNGNMRFAKLIECYKTTRNTGLAYHAGAVYVAGWFADSNKRIGYDATLTGKYYQCGYTSKFDTMGGYYWTKFIGPDTVSSYNKVSYDGDVTVDGQGNIHRFSTMSAGLELTPGNTSQWGSYDLKYDPNGNLLSVYKLQDIDSNYFITLARIDRTTNKSYVLFEYGGGTTTRSGTALAAYNPNGTQIWKDTTNVRAGFNLFTIENSAIYFTANSTQAFGPFTLKGMQVSNSLSSTGGYIAIIGKLDIANGNPQWMYHVDGTNGINSLYDITVLPDKSIAAFGNLAGFKKYRNDTINTIINEGWNPMLFVIDTIGNLIDWEQMHGSGFADNSSGGVICSDRKGNIYVGGKSEANMQAGNLPTYVSNGGNSDYFLGKFGFDCNCTSMANPTS